MTGLIPGEDPIRIESLFRAAEIKALTAHRRNLPPPIEIADDQLPGDASLAAAAARELERRAVRVRYLSADLVTDYSWLALLDIFVCECDLSPVNLADAAQRWHLSPATAARQIAALIEIRLVVRVFDTINSDHVTLRLTDLGRIYIKRILALSR